MSELGQQLFLKSRNQYEAAIRWAFVLVLIGVVAHATIFSRAVEIQKELHVKREAVGTLTSVQQTAEGLPSKVSAFNESIAKQKQRVDQLTTAWFEDLRLRMAQLNVLLEPGYRGVARAEAASTSPSPIQQAQQTTAQDTDTEAREVRKQLRNKLEEVGLHEQLERANDPSERFRRVARFVNEHVVAPSFGRLNERWGVPNTLREDADALKAAIHSIETATESSTLKRALEPGQVEVLTTKTDSLKEVRRKVDAALTAVENLRFDAPEGDEWWRSVQGKEGERLEMAADAKEKVGDIRSLQASRMEEVIAELRRMAKRQKDATQSLSEDLQQIEKQLKQGATELAGMGMGWIPIGGDLKGFLRHFPLLLGVLLAVVVAWPTYRRVSLVRSIRLLSPEDANDNSQRVLWQEYGPPASTMEWSLLGGAVAGYGWIGLATARVAGSPLAGTWGAVGVGVVGGLAFTGALAYRASALRDVRNLTTPGTDPGVNGGDATDV